MLSGDLKRYEDIEKQTIDELMNTLKTKLNFTRKMLIRYVFLPLARKGVGMREQTKSLIVFSTGGSTCSLNRKYNLYFSQSIDLARQALRKLAKRMHEEGRIPEEDLLFYLTLNEIDELFTNRNPLFIAKSKQRKRAIEKMDKWVFDEVNKGYKFKPRNVS